MRKQMTKYMGMVTVLAGLCWSCSASAFQLPSFFNFSLIFTPPFHAVSNNSNIWPLIANHFALSAEDSEHPQVQKQADRMSHEQSYLFALTSNAQPYIYYIYQQTQLRGMPAELALLPMVESDYQATASSSVGAGGLWQLMPGTASGFGVKIKSGLDDRRNIVTSTNAALNYLQYLHDTFHNWDLAIAAYNAGEGTVENAIAHNKARGLPTDYWDLPLPEQTKEYVPKLLAFASIIQAPSHYGVQLMPVPNKPYFTSIDLHKQYSVSKLANLADLTITEFRNLNPEFSHAKTIKLTSYNVLVPKTNQQTFVNNITQIASPSLASPGVIPAAPIVKHAAKTAPIANTQTLTYIVQNGDSLCRIARHFGVAQRDFLYLNHFSGNEVLHPGMELTLLVAR